MLLRNPDKIARKYSAVFFQSEASNDCHNLIITHSHMIVNNNLKIFNIFSKNCIYAVHIRRCDAATEPARNACQLYP